MVWESVALGAGVLCAGGFGVSAWMVAEGVLRRARHRRQVRALGDATSEAGRLSIGAREVRSLDEHVVAYATTVSRALDMRHGFCLTKGGLARSTWFEEHARVAGVEGRVSGAGFCETRMRLALLGLAIGVVAGALLSVELAAVLGLTGLVCGWKALSWSLERRIQGRALELERHLPEMLDVVALGMRSGLSFDRSLALYVQHFSGTLLAQAFDLAQRQWMCGLARRDDALRDVAATYDSPVFERVVEGMIRSLRFGSSMVEGLEAAAREVRVSYRARRQEQVAKAPVKMMVPTGTLILPAMLILVLGPVLLELAGGF